MDENTVYQIDILFSNVATFWSPIKFYLYFTVICGHASIIKTFQLMAKSDYN